MQEPRDGEVATLTFEAALARLEMIVRKLEAGDTTLEDSIGLYTEGQRLRAHCDAKLADAEARIEQLQLGADGKPRGLAPFGDAAAAPAPKSQRPSFQDDLADDDVPF